MESAAAMKHVILYRPQQQRNSVFCWVHAGAISLDRLEFNQWSGMELELVESSRVESLETAVRRAKVSCETVAGQYGHEY
jgi:hypothetical protein